MPFSLEATDLQDRNLWPCQASGLDRDIPMSKLTIVADIHVNPDHLESVEAAFKVIIEATLQEAGCLQYDLHQDNEKPTHFLFYENWESRELWLVHMESSHIKGFQQATEGMIEEVNLFEMTHLPMGTS